MRPNTKSGVALALLLAALWLVTRDAPREAAYAPAPRAPVASTTERPAAQFEAHAPLAQVASEPPRAVEQGPARAVAAREGSAVDPAALERQRQEAAVMMRFAFASLPAIDGCLGPVLGARRPQPFAVRFRREPDDDRLVAVDVRAMRPMRPTTRVARCARTVLGRSVAFEDPALENRAEFDAVISLLLPDDALAERSAEAPGRRSL
jgi:hypothetical protein